MRAGRRIADVSMVMAIAALSLSGISWSGDRAGGPSPAAGSRQPELAAGPAVVDDSGEPLVRVGGTDVDATRRGLLALRSISYDWLVMLPDWEIRFHAADEGAYGYTVTAERRIDVHVRTDQSDELLAHVIAHELGHAVDVARNDGDDRRRWQEVRGIGDAPWWPDSRAADFATGAGDFAESFAAWQVGDLGFSSELGPAPDAEAQALLAELSAS